MSQVRTWGIRSYGIHAQGIRSYGIHSYGMRAQSGWVTETLESKPRKTANSRAERAVVKACNEAKGRYDLPHTTVQHEVTRRAGKRSPEKRSSLKLMIRGPHWEVSTLSSVAHAAAVAAGFKLSRTHYS